MQIVSLGSYPQARKDGLFSVAGNGQAGGVDPLLEAALNEGHGLIAWGDVPPIRRRLRSAIARGELVKVAPGLYATPEFAATYDCRLRTVFKLDPDAVLVDDSAAWLARWRRTEPEYVTCTSTKLRPPPGIKVTRRTIDPHHITIREGWRVTDPLWTALDLAHLYGGDAIDTALRSGITLEKLRRCFASMPQRAGRRRVRWLLDDSRDLPWSEAERAAHRILRAAGISGWKTNYRVRRPNGQRAFFDIAFPKLMLALEIDGFEFHSDPRQIERDKARDWEFTQQGWHVVRVPASLVLHHPAEFLAGLIEILRQRHMLVDSARWAA